MRKAAVAYINFFDNQLKQVIVEVEDDATWKEAYIQAMRDGLLDDGGDYDEANRNPDDANIEWVMAFETFDDMREEMLDSEQDLIVTFV